MAKRLNVDLSFSADTKQAQQNITELSKSLSKIAEMRPVEGMNLNKDLQAAVSSAQALQHHLSSAFNSKTGNFDLSRLSQSLKSANTDLSTLTSGLLKAGMEGEQAFMKVQRALSTANVQINKNQSALAQFATTLKNTARWEISSKIMHGLEGAIAQAYGYAQNLDRSLNDIRIVTGQSSEEMAKFAERANKAAKALSTTTTTYTDASLIYYQQGLSESEVEERTAVTIKMANAAGVSAQTVSDQMTAVWNNFDDGSKSLEYYADVMTALGAATASSTDEISQGLNKFAAVAETVGLSYEYATAALATVTSETRESADVVGTAYKTLFARIQGLQQGDTAEDGTTLNKYSAALAKVGIDIKDVNGEMKDMDSILNEMGAKWGTLAKDQQLALAQTVAGVRQYTQLVALMDNWGTFQENLNTAYNAEGTLQEQADIYAESWEAAQKRVTASMEKVYSALIPEDFLIGFTSGTADVVDGIADIIDGMGGIKTILLLVSSIMLKQFGPSLAEGISTGVEKIGLLKDKIVDVSKNLKNTQTVKSIIVGPNEVDRAYDLKRVINDIASSGNSAAKQMEIFDQHLAKSASTAEKMSQGSIKDALGQGVMTDEFKVYLSDLGKVNNLQSVINQMNSQLTEEQRMQLQNLQEQAIAASERHMQEEATLAELRLQKDLLAEMGDNSVYDGDNFRIDDETSGLNFTSTLAAVGKVEDRVKNLFNIWKDGHPDFEKTEMTIGKIGTKIGLMNVEEKALFQLNKESLSTYMTIEKINAQINTVLKQQGVSAEEKRKAILEILEASKNESDVAAELVKNYIQTEDAVENAEEAMEGLTSRMKQASDSARQFAQATGNTASTLQQGANLAKQEADQMNRVDSAAALVNAKVKTIAQSLMDAVTKTNNFSNSFVKILQGASSVAMGLTSINNSIKTLFSDSATGLEKTSAIITALVTGFTGLSAAMRIVTDVQNKYNAAAQISTVLSALRGKELTKETAAEIASTIATTLGREADQAAIETQLVQIATQSGGTAAINADTIAKIANTSATWAWLAPLLLVVAAIAAVGLAVWGAVKAYDALTQSQEEALDRSRQATDDLTKSTEEAEAAANNLSSAFDKYDSAVDKLNKCTKGTEEWRDALQEANDAALDVLDNLPDDLSAAEINKLYDRDKVTGQIILNEEEIAKHQKTLDNRANIAQFAESSAKVQEVKAEVKVDAEKLAQQITSNQNNQAASTGDVSYLDRNVLQKKILSNLDNLTGLTDSEFKTELEKLGVATQHLTNETLADYQKQVEQLAKTTDGANAKLELIAALQVEEALGDDYDPATKEIVTGQLAKETEALYQTYLDKYTGSGINKTSGANNDIYKTILKDLNDAGYDYDAQKSNAVRGTDANRSFAFLDKDGNEVIRTAEWVAETVAASKALANLSINAETASGWLGNLDENVTDSEAAGIKNLIAEKNFNNMSQHDLAAMNANVGSESDDIINYLTDSLGLDNKEQLLDIFNVDTLTEVSDLWLEAIKNTNDNFASIAEKLPASIESIFNSINNIDDYDFDTQNVIANLLLDAAKNSGTESAAQELGSILSDMLEDPSVDAEILASTLGGIDWQTTNVTELTDILEAAGINTDGFKDKLKDLIDLMQSAGDISFEEASEYYKTFNDIAKSIKDGDTTISNDDAMYLKEAGINIDDFFYRTAEGTWELCGDAEEFYNIVNGSSLDIFKSNIEELKRQTNGTQDLMTSYNQNTIQDKGFEEAWDPHAKEMVAYNIDKDQIQAQLDFLDAVSDIDVSGYELLLSNGELTLEQLKEIQNYVEENSGSWDKLGESINKNAEELRQHYDAVASSAKSIDELNQLLEDGYTDLEGYTKAVEKAGAAEAEAFGLDVDEFEDLSELIEECGSGIAGLSDDLKGNEREANDVAKALLRYDKAIKSIVENSKDWKKALTSGNLQDQAKAIKEMEVAYSDMLDIDMGVLSDSFLKNADNLALMEQAAKGSEAAYKELQAAAAKDILAAVKLDTSLFEQDMAWLQSVLVDGVAFPDIEIGADLNSEPFLAKLTEMVNRTAMTVDQATAYLASMGVDAEIVEDTTVTEDQQEHAGFDSTLVPNRAMVSYPVRYGPLSFGTYTAPIITYDEVITPTVDTENVTKENTSVALKVTSANKSSGGNFKHSNSSNASGNNKKTSSGGGGSKKSEKTPTPAKKQDVSKISDTTDRYHTINEKIDDVAKAMDKAAKAADRLWGKERLDYIEKQNKLLEDEIELLEAKRAEAEAYLREDEADLRAAAADAGFNISLDENGVITNYRDIMDNLAQQLINAEKTMNTFATQEEQDAYEETILDPLKDKIDALQAAIDLYESTLDTIENADSEIEDIMDQIMENNYTKIMEELELEIVVNEDDLELLDYYLSKIEDDFYSMAEAASLMADINGSSQMNTYLENLSDYKTAMDNLTQAYQDGEITQAAYHEGMTEVRDSILDNLESLLELDATMMEYYGDTLSMAQTELTKYTDRLEHQTEVLEHYKNMMEILGKEMDYESMGVVLQGQVDVIENEMKVAEATYDLYKSQADQKKQLLDEAIARGDSAAAEVYQKEWEAAQEAAEDAQSKMLEKTEEWAEAMRAVVENELAGLAKSLEEALTGGTTFDQINTQLERAVSLQEEYLTTTNQIYETNKLMRTAQQEIDKTTNLVAKQRLKDFIKETDQLQDKSKLSKYELEIQQAKYDLLLAEIALEDAQNAKSTVRLQRDAEGNFGYVYTADQTKLAQAQQDLEDAQSELYNIGLEGASNYTEKYTQTMEEMYDTLTSITEAYYNGEITSHEEYEAQMLAAQEYYYAQLENYQELYGIALQTDTRVIQDSWTSGFRTMINNTETWKDKVAVYTSDATATLSNWYSKVEEISNKTGLDNIANKVKNVTDKSDELRDVILGNDGEPGVIDALREELDSVSALTREYATFRSELQNTIEDYEELISKAIQLTRANQESISTSNQAVAAAQRAQQANYSYSSVASSSSSSGSSGSGSGSGSSSSSGGSGSAANKYKATYSLQGKSNTLSGYTSESAARAAAESAIQAAVNALTGITFTEKSSMASSAKSSISIARYDTGGYTGSWGPYGKIGILDEKELILDKNDTANFLASMEVLERILEMIDLQAVNSQLGGMLSTPSVNNSSVSQTIDQNVHIEASFPNVSDRLEIEEAFNTLINKASQYANRK